MRLAIPLIEIQTETINGIPISEFQDTINTGELILVSGYLLDSSGNSMSDFNGLLDVKIFDRAQMVNTLGNDPSSLITDFSVRDRVLLEIETNVINGQFDLVLICPMRWMKNSAPSN